jgi:hypothetical protein
VNQDLRAFYATVVATRAGLLDWLDELPDDVLVQRDERFAFGSLAPSSPTWRRPTAAGSGRSG